MAGKWETQVGQLRLIDGSRQENPANLAAIERQAFLPFKRRGKGRLYVLVELSGGAFGREELCQELVMAITQEYLQTPGTVTYGLRQAVLLANTYLTRENAKVSSEHRVGGVACVVLRNGEMFVAQAGWPMVYLVHREQVQAFPDTMLGGEDASILGQSQTTQVRLFHATVQPKDMILMVDGPMARQLGITRIGQILAGNVSRAMSNLEALAPPEDCAALVIQLSGAQVEAGAQADRWAFMEVEQDERPPEAEAAVSPPPAQPAGYDRRLAPVEAPRPEEVAEPAEVDKAEPAGPGLGERAAGFFSGLGQRARALGERMLPDARADGDVRRTQRRRRAARSRRQRGQNTRQTSWWIAAAVAIPLLAIVLAMGYTWYRNWQLDAQFNAKLEAARSRRDIALSNSESPMVARDDWLEVISLADDAREMQPESVEAGQLRAQAETEIDRIDGVTRLGQAFKLFEYTAPASAPNKVLVAGLDIYVLDRSAGNVYHHALNDLRNALRNPTAEQTLLQQGQPVEGQNIGQLLDIAWMKEGGERQAGALLILDANGLLLEYDPTWEQFQVQTMGGIDGWRSPQELSTFDSNLYLLDPMANQIFKYWGQQYDAAPTRWIAQEGINIATAIDMGIDGSIYLLHQDGRISKYFGGEAASFVLTRMPLPLSHADALYMDVPEISQYLYVADSSETRVVQLDREGAFVRQIKPARDQEAHFAQLSDIFVDEMAAKLYYITAKALYVADIPPMQR